MASDAQIEQRGDLYVLRFERYLEHTVERVWSALTDPEQLAQWLAAAEIDPAPGGRFELHFSNVDHTQAGRVIRYEPPNLFEHTFGDDANGVVRWELNDDGDGCLLKLSHTVYETSEMANFMSGWHAHLELLEALLQGDPQPWDWDRWNEHKRRYAGRVAGELGEASNDV